MERWCGLFVWLCGFVRLRGFVRFVRFGWCGFVRFCVGFVWLGVALCWFCWFCAALCGGHTPHPTVVHKCFFWFFNKLTLDIAIYENIHKTVHLRLVSREKRLECFDLSFPHSGGDKRNKQFRAE